LDSAVDGCLQFGVGDRVIVETPPADAEAEAKVAVSSLGPTTALSVFVGKTGSIVKCFPGIVLVYFDGASSPPVAVPSSYCTLLEGTKDANGREEPAALKHEENESVGEDDHLDDETCMRRQLMIFQGRKELVL